MQNCSASRVNSIKLLFNCLLDDSLECILIVYMEFCSVLTAIHRMEQIMDAVDKFTFTEYKLEYVDAELFKLSPD